MSPISSGIVGIVLMLAFFLFGMPIGFAMGLGGFVGLISIMGLDTAVSSMAMKIYAVSSDFSLTVIPFFILMGEFASISGLAMDIYKAFDRWLRWLPGGLALATIGGCALFGAICGSSVANAATMGTVALPEMKRYKYADTLATGSVAAGGTLGFMIPPSVALVVYAIVSGESVGKLLIAGILPGILLSLVFMLVIVVWVKINPTLIQADLEPVTWADRIKAIRNIWSVVLVFFVVMGGIYQGFFTPTEAGAVGSACLFLIAIARGKMNWSVLVQSLRASAQVVSMLFIIIISAFVFSELLAVSRIPSVLSELIVGLQISKYYVLAIILIFFLILGCLIESIPMLILTMPILLPVIKQLGFDTIWFGIFSVLMVEAALITPPVGLNVYVIAGVAKDIPMMTIFRGVMPFLVGILFLVLVITLFPSLCLILPNMMN